MTITDLLDERRVLPELTSTTKEGVLLELAELLDEDVPSATAAEIQHVLQEREKLNSTAIGDGVAIPHGRLPGLVQATAGFARCPDGVDFESVDGQPTHLFFVLVAPDDAAAKHLKALARISRILKGPDFRTRLLSLEERGELFAAIVEEDGRL